ncbi:hypothetical protein ELH42_12965 [Rhizobium ruizarguesonis]|uniref:Uncharacterized protein n=1 Tax=Rhizobium ruizarguesonis TaxID=2081791 RepID=A0AB38I0M4_9HYPH|nr:hypothetical protein ELH68_14425 [Rhizobium ruizarguesonis]TBA05263.1 hypothetical protein ELH64_12925 [Rhizobium ruizarguesonis]TBA26696.1 hypothetical protein ELH61_13245 [Rhizobium ruizarguesonis]TBA43178.1 hypothetical protein ELH62_12790 [Rhizobium ruizarguesonis]TBA48442.1 hypothetical protein ELH63_12805 [Rhizobium ruizarguesonis]
MLIRPCGHRSGSSHWSRPVLRTPEGRRGNRDVAANLFSPAGRRWRQPDEGATGTVLSLFLQ